MVDDVAAACAWVAQHTSRLGGDVQNISLVGQSAGAHLTALLLLRTVFRRAACDDDDDVTVAASGAAAAAEAAATSSDGTSDDVFTPARWVGISGPYDMPRLAPTLRRRGLQPRLIESLACGDFSSSCPTAVLETMLARAADGGSSSPGGASVPARSTRARTRGESSPARGAHGKVDGAAVAYGHSNGHCNGRSNGRPTGGADATIGCAPTAADAAAAADRLEARWLPIALFHGTADKTVDWEQSREFAANLRAAGASYVVERYYQGKSHTDPILEDPLSLDDPLGAARDDPLLADLLQLVTSKPGGSAAAMMTDADQSREERRRGLWTTLVIRLAKWFNPF